MEKEREGGREQNDKNSITFHIRGACPVRSLFTSSIRKKHCQTLIIII